MLVLSRHRDETIIIGDDIELTVVDIRGDKVRLGIKAPTHIAVHRKEVYDAIRSENQRAALLRDQQINPQQLPLTPVLPGRPRPAITSAVRLKDQNQAERESA